MPLSQPTGRQSIHVRRIECHGFRRDDGLWDIEGHLVDTRSHDIDLRAEPRIVKSGQPIHEMWVRITVDDDLTVRAIEAATEATPTRICPGAIEPMQSLVGLRIAPGWTNAVKQRLGGAKGCTHLMELMWPLATTAHQTVSGTRMDRMLAPAQPGQRPAKIDSCWAYAAEREIVKRFWPEFHTGARSG